MDQCLVCHQPAGSSRRALERISSFSLKPISAVIGKLQNQLAQWEITFASVLESICGVSFQRRPATSLCDECMKLIETYDELHSKAMQVQEKILRLMNGSHVETVVIKTEDIKLEDCVGEDQEWAHGELFDHEENLTDSDVLADVLIDEARKIYCELCNDSYDDTKSLKHHITSVHRTFDGFACSFCQKTFICKSHLRDHVYGHSEFKKEICEVCSARFRTKSKLKRHSRMHSSTKEFSCPICFKEFTQKYNVNAHMKGVHADAYRSMKEETTSADKPKDEINERFDYGSLQVGDEILCDLCDESFKCKESLDEHLKSLHWKRTALICTICSKPFADNPSLKRHLFTHSELKKEVCQVCSARFHTKSKLKRHARMHATTKEFSCPICLKEFTQKYNVNAHMKAVHPEAILNEETGEFVVERAPKREGSGEHFVRPDDIFTCPTCSKNFPTRYKLLSHQQYHNTERNFQCHLCSKFYKTFRCLQMHLKIHANATKRVFCDLCNDSFSKKQSLTRHFISAHTTRKEFLCTFCPKAFASDSTLRHHLFVHSDVKKEVCLVCNAKFHTKAKLKRHSRTHSTTKEFSCPICFREFTQRYNVNAHIKTVHADTKVQIVKKEFPCNICGRKFSHLRKLSQHLTEVHNVIIENEAVT